MKKAKAEKAITLIALIITIIVLLILALVTIGAVNDDGILQYAKNSANKYEKATENETGILQGYLDKIEENIPKIELTLADGTKVTLTKENVGDYLGKKVKNYTGQINVTIGSETYRVSPEYRLYYVDFDNKYQDGPGTIYLKAEDNNNYYTLPTTDTTLEDAPNIKIKNLNPALYANGVTSPSSSNSNMKAVTWLTNTTNWEGLADLSMSENINYIVGSPSLEMMIDSFNTHYELTGDTPDCTPITVTTPITQRKLFYRYQSNSNGYEVGPCAENNTKYDTYTSNNSVYTDSKIDSMYYPNISGYYWLASPSSFANDSVMHVSHSCGGRVIRTTYSSDQYAICPLVSLKSSAQLELED